MKPKKPKTEKTSALSKTSAEMAMSNGSIDEAALLERITAKPELRAV